MFKTVLWWAVVIWTLYFLSLCVLTSVFKISLSGLECTKSDVDNTGYCVRSSGSNEEKLARANTLSKIQSSARTLISRLELAHGPSRITRKLSEKWARGGSVVKESQKNTFTVNKSDIYLCLEFDDYNTLMYVLIHEMAHMANYDDNDNPIEGHGDEFIATFKFLLTEAIACGIYSYVNYNQSPKRYCGMLIDSG